MRILERLCDKNTWESYLAYKVGQGNLHRYDREDLRRFIDGEEYLAVLTRLKNGEGFSVPQKRLVNKTKVGRKRVVYMFDRAENYVLKLMAFLLHDYDDAFAPNVFSFRKHRHVRMAAHRILSIPHLDERYVFKLDISDYFRSVDITKLLPLLETVLADDRELFMLIKELLCDERVIFEGTVMTEQKGILPGAPISGFLANLYLSELDWRFYNAGIPYMRYSDDIIVFAENEQAMQRAADEIKATLHEKGLTVNHDKEVVTLPHQKWTFLGFSYHNGTVDVCDVSVDKLKAKMRRKTHALKRWADRKGLAGVYAARAFVKRFNVKLYDNPVGGELTWTRWYFPVINTADSLRVIDEYMQDCIRYLATGKRTKGRFAFTYDDIKALGYRNLVHEYYAFKKQTETGDS